MLPEPLVRLLQQFLGDGEVHQRGVTTTTGTVDTGTVDPGAVPRQHAMEYEGVAQVMDAWAGPTRATRRLESGPLEYAGEERLDHDA